jgi:tRNA 2-thiouridine synthesizing protein A
VDKVKHRAYAPAMEFDHDIDALGLLCPLPVLKAAKRLRAMAPGEVLRLRADDPAAVVDVPHFCRETGNDLIATTGEDSAATSYFIRKG